MHVSYFYDFIRLFQYVFKKAKDIPLIQLKRSYEAVSLSMKCFLYSGFFLSLMGSIQILKLLNDPAKLGENLLMALLAIFYAFCFKLYCYL